MNESLKFGKGVTGCLFCLLAAGILTGCSKTETDGGTDGKQPMTFTALVDALTSTRATTDNTWEGNEEVAVKIGDEVKKYTAAADGTLSVAKGETAFYWTTPTAVAEAWQAASYSDTKPSSFRVSADQSAATAYRQSDMIYAAAATINYGNPLLTFRHLPVKGVVNLQAGKGVTEDEVRAATVTFLNQHLTAGTIATDGSVAQQTAPGGYTVIPNVVATPADACLKTVQALLVPQKNAASGPFIKISLGGQEFVYAATLDLLAGTQYTYTVTVAKNGITVTACGDETWTGSETPVKSYDPYKASDLKPGDYYYSDGTWSDGGLRKKYADGTFAIDNIAPTAAKTVIGIVYWVGDITADDPLLKADHPACTHGLVVALQNATLPKNPPFVHSELWVRWSFNYETVINDWTNAPERGGDKVDITVADKRQGYANTQALTAYNAQQIDRNDVLPIAAIARYATAHPAPTNSSGWYFPSFQELKYVCWGQGNTQGVLGRDLLDAQFGKLSGALPFEDDTSWNGTWWWSSSEHPSDINKALTVLFDSGNVSDIYKNSSISVRGILAF
ncbi:MAG: fimbrillin family protein [Odoribacter sp.]